MYMVIRRYAIQPSRVDEVIRKVDEQYLEKLRLLPGYEGYARSLDVGGVTPEQYAQLSRTALRGFDACSAGDERFANDFFNKLGSALAKPEDVFNQINSSPLAKKK